jgi:hypothetical protein
MTLLPRLKAGFYLVVAGLVFGHPRPFCRCGASAFQHLPLPFLRTKEAALFIGVSCRTLEKHRIYGTGPNDSKVGAASWSRLDRTSHAWRCVQPILSDP